MNKSNKRRRALEDDDHNPMTLLNKRRWQDRASHSSTPARANPPSSPPTLLNSPAPITPPRPHHPSTPSHSGSYTSSSGSDSSSDASSLCSDSDASTSSADTGPPHPRSYLPYLLPRLLSPSTTSSGTSTESDYTSASDDISELLSSSSSSDADESLSSSPSGTTSSPSSSSSSGSTHPSAPPRPSALASLTAANLSHLQSRLNALLPKMKRANAELEVEREEWRLGERDIENVRDGGREGEYIEMDLGLGVLEEKREIGVRGDDGGRGRMEDGRRPGGGDALGDMMGEGRGWRKGKGKVGIEEVRS